MGMQYWPQKAIGFQIDEDIAKELDVEAAFAEWEKEYMEGAFIKAMKEKFKMPDFDLRIQFFSGERGGEINALEGFEYDKTYVYFPGMSGKEKGWKPFVNRLTKKCENVNVESATWTQLM